MTDQAPELLPCPFCGSSKIEALEHLDWVCCQDCGASLEDVEPSARKLWNTRPPSERPVAQMRERPHSIYGQYQLDNWTDDDFAKHTATTRKTLAWLLELEKSLAAERPSEAAVAWQKRPLFGEVRTWTECESDAEDQAFWREQEYEIRPLYAIPHEEPDIKKEIE